MEGWDITNLLEPYQIAEYGSLLRVRISDTDLAKPEAPAYWLAPQEYLGNKACSPANNLQCGNVVTTFH